MCTKGICAQVSIHTYNQPLIDTWSTSLSTLDRHLRRYSVNTRLTSWSTVGGHLTNFCRHPIKCWSIHMSQSTLRQLSPTVNQMLIECLSRVNHVSIQCWPSIARDVAGVLIEGINWHSTVDAFSTHDTEILVGIYIKNKEINFPLFKHLNSNKICSWRLTSGEIFENPRLTWVWYLSRCFFSRTATGV